MITTKLGNYYGDVIDVVQGKLIGKNCVYPDYIVVAEPWNKHILNYRICTHDILAFK